MMNRVVSIVSGLLVVYGVAVFGPAGKMVTKWIDGVSSMLVDGFRLSAEGKPGKPLDTPGNGYSNAADSSSTTRLSFMFLHDLRDTATLPGRIVVPVTEPLRGAVTTPAIEQIDTLWTDSNGRVVVLGKTSLPARDQPPADQQSFA